MSTAHTELPDFVTPQLIEAVVQRAMFAQDFALNHPHHDGCKQWMKRGVRAAQDRNRWLMKLLDQGAEHLRRLNDAQQDRFASNDADPNRPEHLHGVDLRKQDFTEFSQWRAAYETADTSGRNGAQHAVFAWLYGAAYEACVRGRVATNSSFRF